MPAIREARRSDLPDIERTLLEAFADHRAHYARDDFDRYLASLVANLDDAVFFVATDGAAIVGVAALYPPGAHAVYPGIAMPPWPATWACLRRLAVARSHRRLGLARRLTDVRLRRARELGAEAVGLHTSFPEAQAMYRRLGWTRLPAYDFAPVPGIHVEAYGLTF